MNNYEQPKMEIVLIYEDIVRTSNINDGDYDVGEMPLFG